MKRIKLTQGKVALVDDRDFDWLNQWKWYAHKDHCTFYAVRKSPMKKGKRQLLRMHRVIINATKDQLSDHANSNGLDNQRSNLRTCTPSQNQQNKRPQKNGTSKYKGVNWRKGRNHWRALLRYEGKNIYLGSSHSEIVCARLYDAKAKELFGEFARTNFENKHSKT